MRELGLLSFQKKSLTVDINVVHNYMVGGFR